MPSVKEENAENLVPAKAFYAHLALRITQTERYLRVSTEFNPRRPKPLKAEN
jgi:hypothetical protein